MTEHEALHVLALPSAQQQDIGWQGIIVANKTLKQSRRVAFAIGRDNGRAHRDRAGSLLPEALRPCRKGQSGHRNRAQDRGAVL